MARAKIPSTPHGRKIAEWGTALQPACFGYDDMDNMTMLRTFRADGEVINTDPSERSDYDQTTWVFNPATGLEISKTYADNTSVVKTYDAYNRLATETDARGNVKSHTYEHARGLHLGTSYTVVDGTAATPARSFTYNHLGQMTQLVDDAGTRTFGYNSYGEHETDSLVVDGDTHLITETRDSFGRSTGYTYAKNGAVQQTVSTGYGNDGRIASAGFLHGGAAKNFGYTYLAGTNLLQVLTKPNGMTLTQTYEATRDLLTGMAYHRGSTLVAQRTYNYDMLGRPTTRNTARQGSVMNDTFAHNTRSELVEAQVNGTEYEYAYDNIGNRQQATEGNEVTVYDANALNQYTAISENGAPAFQPQFDADGNQTLIKTETGIWSAVYNAENRPVSFTNADSSTVVECAYDSMGRRAYKKVTTNGSVTLHHRYLYRGYLQIACVDLTRSHHPCLWLLTWDPSEPVATRPLAIQIDGTWHSYGWDLTKNICELYGTNGYISNTYTYSPFGHVTSSGFINQPIQWSSEVWDNELSLVNYNYRQYNPSHGVWLSVDPIGLASGHYNLYSFLNNSFSGIDFLGLKYIEEKLRLYPTSGKIGTVNARFNIETRQMEVETEKWIMPSWYNWLTSKENTGQRSWRAATEEELRIYFTLDDDNVLSVERDPSVLLARAYKEISNTIKINEQIILGNIILDLSTMGLKFPTSYGRLVHYTSPKFFKTIKAERLLRGKGGIFTTTNESACSLEKVALLGISAKRSETIHIPSTAYKYFHEVHPIGLYSFSRYLGGTRYAAPGTLNLDTGVLSQTGPIIKPLIYLYSIDIVVNIFVMYLYYLSRKYR